MLYSNLPSVWSHWTHLQYSKPINMLVSHWSLSAWNVLPYQLHQVNTLLILRNSAEISAQECAPGWGCLTHLCSHSTQWINVICYQGCTASRCQYLQVTEVHLVHYMHWWLLESPFKVSESLFLKNYIKSHPINVINIIFQNWFSMQISSLHYWQVLTSTPCNQYSLNKSSTDFLMELYSYLYSNG